MKHPIWLYCLLSFAITWSIAFGIYFLFQAGRIDADQLNFYHTFGAIGPTIGALVTAAYCYGEEGVWKLLKRFAFWEINLHTLLFALSPIVFFWIGLIFYRFLKHEWFTLQAFSDANWTSFRVFISWGLPLLTYAIFEEIGWRGFLLPHLQEKYTAWTSTVILSVIWAFWHVPFFFYRFDFSPFISIGFFFGIFVGALILTFIYNTNRGFLLPVVLFHFLNNFFSMFDKELIVAVLSTGFVFLAIYIYFKYGRANLSEEPRVRNYFKVQSASKNESIPNRQTPSS